MRIFRFVRIIDMATGGTDYTDYPGTYCFRGTGLEIDEQTMIPGAICVFIRDNDFLNRHVGPIQFMIDDEWYCGNFLRIAKNKFILFNVGQ